MYVVCNKRDSREIGRTVLDMVVSSLMNEVTYIYIFL